MLAMPSNEVNSELTIYLTPLIPLSIIWICILSMRGKDIKKRGFAPLKYLKLSVLRIS